MAESFARVGTAIINHQVRVRLPHSIPVLVEPVDVPILCEATTLRVRHVLWLDLRLQYIPSDKCAVVSASLLL